MAESALMIGSSHAGQAHALVKDARYYYSRCLDETSMDTVRSSIICIEYC